MRLGLPLFYLWRLFQLRERRLAPETLLCIGCAALACDALVDYPFDRPETLLIYVVALGFVARSVSELGGARSPTLTPGVWRASAGVLALFLMLVLGSMSIGLSAKKLGERDGAGRALRVALRFWPWDEQWKLRHLVAFADAKDPSAMERLADDRMRAWPNDPESHLIAAALLESKGDFLGATHLFRRALVTVANGRCYLPAYEAYLAMVDRPDFKADAPSPEAELSQCAASVRDRLRRLLEKKKSKPAGDRESHRRRPPLPTAGRGS